MFLGNTLTLQEQFFITHTKFLVLKMFETALILLYLTAVVKTKEEGVYFEVRENHFLFDEKTVWDQKVDSLLSCSQICYTPFVSADKGHKDVRKEISGCICL